MTQDDTRNRKGRVLNVRLTDETKRRLDEMTEEDGVTMVTTVETLVNQSYLNRKLLPRKKKEIIDFVSHLLDQQGAK